ncbi:ACT domain-containing protein [uncultured Victivallis sp.]|uniref:ACT domain-containing protein n=1 Tax=uncultured Victivallis sp. TaxID=354118 RepID=UPI0025DDA668|nr:ACT domain-containing protein [uncultured Victivallis sp.]
MPIKQLSLFVENQPGSLSKVCQVLKENRINISTLSLADTREYGILRLLIQEHERARDVLEKAGYVVKVTDVLALTVPDHPGGLADTLAILDKHALSVEYMYAFTYGRSNKAIIVFRFENPEKAIAMLKDEPIELVRAEELF